MNMSFQEKSLWLVFLSVTAFSAFYFAQALPGAGPDVMPGQMAIFVAAIVALVVVQVAGHIVIAIVDRRTDTDERDGRIALKGTRNGAYVLATGVFLALCAGLVTEGNFVFTHVLFGSWVLAQLVETGSQLWMYRRGA